MRAAIHARHDLEIGENCMIGAMSFVNKSIPANTTAVGVPCKVVKEIGYRSAADLARMETDNLTNGKTGNGKK